VLQQLQQGTETLLHALPFVVPAVCLLKMMLPLLLLHQCCLVAAALQAEQLQVGKKEDRWQWLLQQAE
jgi:hypothetical protein